MSELIEATHNLAICPKCGYISDAAQSNVRQRCSRCQAYFFPPAFTSPENLYHYCISDMIRVMNATPSKHSIRRFMQRIDHLEPQEAKGRIGFMWQNALYLPHVSNQSRRTIAKYFFDFRNFFVIMIASAKSKRIITIYKPSKRQIAKWHLRRRNFNEDKRI